MSRDDSPAQRPLTDVLDNLSGFTLLGVLTTVKFRLKLHDFYM